ncbi:MAG: cytoskeletal protein CcmA (bactofilin family) [Cryomorphaceae bacterium]
MSVFKKYISNNEEEIKPTAPSAQASTQNPNQAKPVQPLAPHSASAPAQSNQNRQSPPTSTLAATNGRNVLSSDVEIKGKVKFTNDLVVDGLIEGEIHSDGSLTVGENARIKAEVHTRSVVVYGKVHGNITVTDRVELKANAELIGDIKAATISIEAGAIFVGKSTVGAPSIQVTAAPTEPAKPISSNNSNNNNSNKKGKFAAAS